MLKKENRLSKRNDILEVKEKGEMISAKFFSLLSLKRKDKLKKFAFIVSKKISKRAVDRNKIRRLISEALRLNLEKIPNDYSFLFLVKKEILSKNFIQVESEIKKIFKIE